MWKCSYSKTHNICDGDTLREHHNKKIKEIIKEKHFKFKNIFKKE